MTAWVTALVPLVVALVSAARWPTLGKRIKDHAALVKDLPPDAAKELQALMVDEVRRLAERDRQRLDRRVDWWLNARRAAITVNVLAVGTLFVWFNATLVLPQGSPSDEPPYIVIIPALIIAAVGGVVTAWLASQVLIGSREERLAKSKRIRRQAG